MTDLVLSCECVCVCVRACVCRCVSFLVSASYQYPYNCTNHTTFEAPQEHNTSLSRSLDKRVMVLRVCPQVPWPTPSVTTTWVWWEPAEVSTPC